jgi:hypothetical protein
MNPEALRLLPDGNAWLMVIFSGDTQDEADSKARALIEDLRGTEHEPAVRFYDDPEHEKELADVREVALGATARVPDMPDTWEGWEDSAVPPDRLGDYLRDLAKLYDEFGYSGAALYGHFGQGCVHTRIPSIWSRPRASRSSAGSSSGLRTWWCPMVARFPASTATASRAANCYPRCSATTWSGPSRRSRQSSIRAT